MTTTRRVHWCEGCGEQAEYDLCPDFSGYDEQGRSFRQQGHGYGCTVCTRCGHHSDAQRAAGAREGA